MSFHFETSKSGHSREQINPFTLDIPPPALAAFALAEVHLSSPAADSSKRQMRKFWKELSKHYTAEQIVTMKHVQKYGDQALRHYEGVETRLSI